MLICRKIVRRQAVQLPPRVRCTTGNANYCTQGKCEDGNYGCRVYTRPFSPDPPYLFFVWNDPRRDPPEISFHEVSGPDESIEPITGLDTVERYPPTLEWLTQSHLIGQSEAEFYGCRNPKILAVLPTDLLRRCRARSH